jgi:hypothetical protein
MTVAGAGRPDGAAGVLRFQPAPVTGGCLHVDGEYSRSVWLPVLGPVAWVLWGTIASRLPPRRDVTVSMDELAGVCGLGAVDVVPTLDQLVRFGPALPLREDAWRVHRFCPPLPERLVEAAPARVRTVHRQVFPSPGVRAGTVRGRGRRHEW